MISDGCIYGVKMEREKSITIGIGAKNSKEALKESKIVIFLLSTYSILQSHKV